MRQSMQWWRPRIEALERGGFLRVAEIVVPQAPPAVASYRVLLPNSVEVVVSDDFNSDTLTRLLAAISP